MFDNGQVFAPHQSAEVFAAESGTGSRRVYFAWKRTFDVAGGLALLSLMIVAAGVLLLLNPFFNSGSLFYVQDRMGLGCRKFRALKFRTMLAEDAVERGAFDGLEHHRITALGRFLRRSRIDELPQAINVLVGDMSLIGPRPDFYPHAMVYLDGVPGYRDRHAMRPGISGFAQIKHGYIEGIEGVRRKVRADLQYAARASVAFDLWIAWQTVKVILGRKGM